MHLRPLALALLLAWLQPCAAQEMQPRAYLPSPIGVGFAGVSYGFSSGGLLFDPSLPIEDARVRSHGATLSVGGTLGVLGRTAQVLVVAPYAAANLSGRVADVEGTRYRSGLADMTLRYSMNVLGAPAMSRKELAQHRRNTFVGVSVTATAPAGQYDPNVVVNVGTNRWAFKPEVGVSRALGKWAVEGAFGAWLYARNTKFNGATERTQRPLWSGQAHLVRIVNRRQWVALDFTYFVGGEVRVNGRPAVMSLANTRVGATYGVLLSPRQALRFSYFSGVTTRVGSDVSTVGVAYQFLWSTGR